MELNLDLEAFKGPLDLLLQLVEKNKLNIYDIPIAKITDQYLDCVREMAERKMEFASEFLVIAAELLVIKSKLLLPEDDDDEEEAEELREDLQARLIEYKKVKILASLLKERSSEGRKRYFGKESVPADIKKYRPKPNLIELLKKKDSLMLKRSFMDACRRAALRKDKVRSDFKVINREPVDVEERIRSIKDICKKNKTLNFRKLVPKGSGVMTEVVSFLVLLEMMKKGYVEATQISFDKDIEIKVKKDIDDFSIVDKIM